MGVPKENGFTVAVLLLMLLLVALLALKEKDELPPVVLPNAGGGAPELALVFGLEKLKAPVTGAAADEFDPAVKEKLPAGVAAGAAVVLLLVDPIPPKENGLFAVDVKEAADVFAGAGAVADAPNENGDWLEVTLD